MSDSFTGPVLEETGPSLYCVAGLGNPGVRYADTPHNLGFLIVDEIARRHSIRMLKNEGSALTGLGYVRDQQVLLAKPQTFMNNSGLAVAAILKARKLKSKDLIVVHDELDLLWTGLRIRKNGSAAGHNGVKSIIAALKADSFTRVRVGVRPDHPLEDAATYVLAPYERALRGGLDEVVSYTSDAVEFIIAEGAAQAMAKFNRRARGIVQEEE
jgi:peptidyl-tRNA hydrolase, PTH1 family